MDEEIERGSFHFGRGKLFKKNSLLDAFNVELEGFSPLPKKKKILKMRRMLSNFSEEKKVNVEMEAENIC